MEKSNLIVSIKSVFKKCLWDHVARRLDEADVVSAHRDFESAVAKAVDAGAITEAQWSSSAAYMDARFGPNGWIQSKG